MARSWGLSIGESERIDLERIVMDKDQEAALVFLKDVIYPKIKEAEKPGSCFHETSKPVEQLERPVSRHKKLGSK
ncbi:MAG: hypothetical protein A2W01_11025 [Candidatus Solincola sediminis]|uniref:Uncharacterized protein n=1 Tax=Candidatus Solincola sediminis TaxID=1797199 RepID=A0A1F2WNX2_9ACTN|nr:MAG: hypothetical protein A2Y75_10245 [Candidatus Solincola sediminis]OFW61837.1 MAG: hypothetical protein A2W01_11025 [Candidatus Solincola sediminis]